MSDKLFEIKKKLNRKILAAFAALLVSGIICLAAAGNCLDSREGVIEEYEWQETEEGYQMQCFQMGVDKGTHTLIIGYESEQDLSYRLVDLAKNDGENRLGEEIASGILPGGENQLGIEFELTRTAEKLTLYIESTDNSARPGYWILEIGRAHV